MLFLICHQVKLQNKTKQNKPNYIKKNKIQIKVYDSNAKKYNLYII